MVLGKNLPDDLPIDEYTELLPPDECWHIPSMPVFCDYKWRDFHLRVSNKKNNSQQEQLDA